MFTEKVAKEYNKQSVEKLTLLKTEFKRDYSGILGCQKGITLTNFCLFDEFS